MATLTESVRRAITNTIVPPENKALARLSDIIVKTYGDQDAESLLVLSQGAGPPATDGTVVSMFYHNTVSDIVYLRTSRDPIEYTAATTSGGLTDDQATKLRNLEYVRIGALGSDIFDALRITNPPTNIAVATDTFTITGTNSVVDVAGVQITGITTGDVFIWDSQAARWERIHSTSDKLDTDLGNADNDLTDAEKSAFREKIGAADIPAIPDNAGTRKLYSLDVPATSGDAVWTNIEGVGSSIGATLFSSAADLPVGPHNSGWNIPNVAWTATTHKPSWIDTSSSSSFEIEHDGQEPPANVNGLWIRGKVGNVYKGRRFHEWAVHTTSQEQVDVDFGTNQSVRFRVNRNVLGWRFSLLGNGGDALPAGSRIEVTWAISGSGPKGDKGDDGDLTTVSSDASLTGDGTPSSPLAVANPLPAAPANTAFTRRYHLTVPATTGAATWTESTAEDVVRPTTRGGLSPNAVPDASELTIVGDSNGDLAFQSFTGQRFILVARLASEDDIEEIYDSLLGEGEEDTFANYGKYGSNVTVVENGENVEYAVWVSSDPETAITTPFTIRVR